MNDKIRQLVAKYSTTKQDVICQIFEEIHELTEERKIAKQIIRDLKFLEDGDGEDLIETLNIMMEYNKVQFHD